MGGILLLAVLFGCINSCCICCSKRPNCCTVTLSLIGFLAIFLGVCGAVLFMLYSENKEVNDYIKYTFCSTEDFADNDRLKPTKDDFEWINCALVSMLMAVNLLTLF